MNLLTILHHQYLSRNRQLSHNQKGKPPGGEGGGICTGGSYIFPPMETSMTLTILGWRNERRREISLIAVIGVPSRFSAESIRIVLSATICPERRSRARLPQHRVTQRKPFAGD